MKIAFTGGGTGGHIYPALAIAEELSKAGRFEIFWIGQKTGMDKSIVEAAGIRFYGICAGKLRRYFSLRNITDIFKILLGFFSARAILGRERPALLFSKGGFVSVPPVLAAASLGITVHTHESDFSPGLATKINSRFAARIWTAYSETAERFPRPLAEKVRAVGNPVRGAFYAADAARGRAYVESLSGVPVPAGLKIMLVLGGSQGAKEVNDLVTACLPALRERFFIVHQTGGGDGTSANYLAVPYIKSEMPDVLAFADLVLGRSGAGTVWESAAAGVPMVLVPLAGSGTRGDQVENAEYFVRAGAALSFVHPEPELLQRELLALAEDEGRLRSMALASKKTGAQNAAAVIAGEIALCP